MRRFLMELMGTFFLMLAITFTGNPFAIGLMFMALVFIGSYISGAHYNSAVSVSMFFRGRLSASDLLWYILAQVTGAVLAAFFFFVIAPKPFVLDLPAGINWWTVGIPELLLTYVFCLVILVVATSQQYPEIRHHGMVQGLTLTAIGFIGGLFNPAIALGALLFNGAMGNTAGILGVLIVHVLAPVVGGIAAAYKFKYLYPNQP